MVAESAPKSTRDKCMKIASHPHIKCTYNYDAGEFRVTLVGLSRAREEAVAYYTSDYYDAWHTAKLMSERRVAELSDDF